ncbi:MAG: baseplate J/gp47 family protein [Bacteroidota bacterium]
MAYQKKAYLHLYESLAADLKKRLPGITDFEQGSVIRSMLETLAYEQAVFYEQLDHIYNASFVNTATAANLEKVVAILDITRGEPDYAQGDVTFFKDPTFQDTAILPVGTLVTTEDNPDEVPQRKAYRTLEEAVLTPEMTEATVKIQAETRGAELETAQETIVVMPVPVEGVSGVINSSAISFIGRKRETDEELRGRAKKTLLAAGKASEISIEQALLSMPNILDVKIANPKNEAGDIIPGVINVYVDGLSETNSQQLSNRLEEVKAAGIYTRLKPAEITTLTGVLKLVPHESVLEKELPELESQVADQIAAHVSKKKMGHPLSMSQLTTAILQVKGVQDLVQYDFTFREQSVVLNPPTVPSNGMDPDSLEIKYLIGINEEGQEQYAAPEDSKAILFSDCGRFRISELRIAARDHALPVQVRVQLSYPNAASRASIVGKAQTALDALDFVVQEVKDPELPVSDEVYQGFLDQVNAYFQGCKIQLLDQIDALQTDPLKDQYSALLTYIKTAAGLFEDDRGNTIQLDETELKNQVFTLIKPQMKEVLKEALATCIMKVAASCAGAFPQSQLLETLIEDMTQDLTRQIAALRREVTAINQELSNKRLTLISESLTAQQKATLKAEIAALQADALARQADQDARQNQVNGIRTRIAAQVTSWSEQAREKLESLNKSTTLNGWVSTTGKASDLDIVPQLRATTYDGVEYPNQPIPVSFVETPVFDYLWVHSFDLQLAGTLLLDVPVGTSAIEKEELAEAARRAINHMLENQRPETDLLFSDIIQAAQAPPKVLGARLERNGLGLVPARQKTPDLLPERLADDALKVASGEKVLLSDHLFTIS